MQGAAALSSTKLGTRPHPHLPTATTIILIFITDKYTVTNNSISFQNNSTIVSTWKTHGLKASADHFILFLFLLALLILLYRISCSLLRPARPWLPRHICKDPVCGLQLSVQHHQSVDHPTSYWQPPGMCALPTALLTLLYPRRVLC